MSEAKIVLTAVDQTKAAFTSVKSSLEGVKVASLSLRDAIGGLAAAAGLLTLADQVKHAIEAADALNKLSQRTGIATEQLSQLEFAAKLSDVTTESLANAVKKLNVSISEGLAGDKAKAEAFRNLGLSLKDATGHAISADQALLKIADTFSTARDGATKTAYAVALMGKAGDEMIPLLNGGSGAIEDMMHKADRLGLTISRDFARNAEEFNDNLTILKASTSGLAVAIGSDLVHSLGIAVQKMAEATVEGGKFGGVVAFIQTFLTGDDLHKANVQMVETADRILQIQNAMDRIRAKGLDQTAQDSATLRELQKELDTMQALYNTARNYAHLLQGEQPGAKPPSAVEQKAGVELKPLTGGAASTSASEYDALIKRIKEKIDAEQQELTLGRELSDFEKFAIKVKQDEAELLKKFPGLHQAEIDKLLAKASALDKDIAARKADQQEALNYAKDWAKTEQELADDMKARADERDRVYKAIADHRQDLADNNAMLQAEVDLIGASDYQRQVGLGYLAIELETKRKIKEINQDLLLNEEQRAKAIKDVNENADLQKQQLQLRAQLDTWHSIDDTAREAFTHIFDQGTNTFKRIGETLKTAVLDLLYQMEVRPWIIRIAAQLGVTGGGVGAAAAGVGGMGSMGGIGNYANLLGGGMSLGNQLGSLYANATGTGIDGLLATNGAYGTAEGVAGGAMGTVGAALPYIGALYAASQGQYGAAAGMAIGSYIMPGIGTIVGYVLGSLLDGHHGGPKQDSTSQYYAGGLGLGDHPAGADKAANAGAAALQSQYDALVASYGGTGGLKFGIGTSTDPEGTSPSFADVTLINGTDKNSKIANFANYQIGRSPEELQAAVAELANRAMLSGLQHSHLGGIIGDYFDALGDVAKLSADRVKDAIDKITKASNEKAGLDETWFQLTHTAEENLQHQRQKELDALDDSNKAMAYRIYALQDELVKQEKAKQALAEYNDMMDGVRKNITSFLDKLNATPAGLLSPEQQLANSKDQFERQLALARTGDRDALGSITQFADQYIEAQKGYSASGKATADVIAYVKSQVAGLPGQVSATDYVAKAVGDGADLLNASLQDLIARADQNAHDQIDAVNTAAQEQIQTMRDLIAQEAAAFDAAEAARNSRLDQWRNGMLGIGGGGLTDANDPGYLQLAGQPSPSTGGLPASHVGATNPALGWFGFAAGGVMTSFGPLPLRTYASGGVASTPQAAIFGEGSLPEAYVPLPDGRRIPVAMQGGGEPAVVAQLRALQGAWEREIAALRALVADVGRRQLAAGQQVADNTAAIARAGRLRAAEAHV